MKLHLKIKSKMLFYILSTSILIFAFTIGYISIKNHNLSIDYAKKIAGNVSSENALLIEKSLSENLSVLKTMAEAFSIYNDLPEKEWKELFIKMYKKVYVQNPNFYKLWDSWELSGFDTTWMNDYGRYAVTVYYKDGKVGYSTSHRSMDGDAGMYAKIKSINKNMLWEPYWDEFLEDGEEKKFMTSISAPIRVNGEYRGIVAADIIVNSFQDIVENINPYKGCTAFLVSNGGVFVGHSDALNIGKTITDVLPELDEQFNLSARVKNGDLDVFAANNQQNRVILSIAPIKIGDYNAPWSLCLMIPEKQILVEAHRTLKYSLLVALVGLLILSIIVIFIARNISGSLITTTKVLQKLSIGDINQSNGLNISSGDEVQEMAESVNSLLQGLNKTTDFANEIEKGNLDADFSPLSEKDTLGNALLEMRHSLLEAQKNESKRKIEDEKQNWATNGLAAFSELLRDNSKDINEVSYSILNYLIDYLNLNQGGLFIAEKGDDDEMNFVMTAAVAYGRNKFMEKTIAMGEGLVGRCGYEKQSIYLVDVPDQYMKITSGLGTANPTIILLVPLLLNEEIHGVIELASFNKLEPYQINFIETIGESIASTLSSAKIAKTTSRLLDSAKIQADELLAQEEEMRQNLEELQATQEEAIRRETAMDSIILALNNTAFLIELDTDTNVISINESFKTFIGLPGSEVIGRQLDEIWKSYNQDIHEALQIVKTGETVKHLNKVVIRDATHWISETYTPIYNKETGDLDKIYCVGFDVSDIKN